MTTIVSDQEMEDWILLLHVSGVTALIYGNGELHANHDAARARKAYATLALLAQRLGGMSKQGRALFMQGLTTLDQRRLGELEAYHAERARAMNPKDLRTAAELSLLAPQVH